VASPIFENDAVSIGSGDPAAPPFYTRAQNVLIINIFPFHFFLVSSTFQEETGQGKKNVPPNVLAPDLLSQRREKRKSLSSINKTFYSSIPVRTLSV
jgi:hypothetical protein